MSRLKNITEKVKYILTEHAHTRDSDSMLIARFVYMYHYNLVEKGSGGEPSIKLKDINNVTSFESITRARRIIQQNYPELGPISEQVRKARGMKEESYRTEEVREAGQV
jgi:hypothetical protein